MNTTKYPFLDSLRWLAIVMVLVYHLQFLWLPMPKFTEYLLIGVSLFFIISAYTLALSQSTKIQRKNTWRNFYIRRFFRIYPLFFVIITLLYILSFKLQIFSSIYEYIPGRINYISHILFVFGFSPDTLNTFHIGERSLFNELIFYLLFPLLFVYMKKWWRNTLVLFGVSVVIFRLWDIIAFSDALQPYTQKIFEWRLYAYHFPLYHLPDFMMGFILFHAHHRWFNKPLNNKILIPISTIHLWLFGYILYLNTTWLYVNHIVRVLLFGALAWLMMQWWWIYAILNNKILTYIGKISYSLYLLNLPIIFGVSAIMHHYNFNIIWWSIITMILLFFIASITYKFEIRWIYYWKKFEK